MTSRGHSEAVQPCGEWPSLRRQQSHEQQRAAEKEAVYQERLQIVIGILKENGGSMEPKMLKDKTMSKIAKGASTVNVLLKFMLEDKNPLIVQKDNVVMLTTA